MSQPRRRAMLALLCLLTWHTAAHAGLQVFPTRIHLSDQNRVANISLRHVGNKPGKYRVTPVFYRMKEDGGLELVETPAESERSAVKMIRFSPRTVTLPPNVEQVVRVLYAGPKTLPEGEYRAHLHFEPSEAEDEGIAVKGGDGKVSMQLHAKVAVAVPVIYRQGAPKLDVKLSDLKVVTMNDKPAFSIEMASQGTAFAFGDFRAFFVAAGDKEPQEVAIVRGVASYLPKRTVSFELKPPGAVKLKGGKLRLEFREPEESGGKVIATAETPLP